MKNENNWKIVSKFALLNAFANGLPLNEIGANVINSIEREDGSNASYNVSFVGAEGRKFTVHLYAK